MGTHPRWRSEKNYINNFDFKRGKFYTTTFFIEFEKNGAENAPSSAVINQPRHCAQSKYSGKINPGFFSHNQPVAL